MEDFVSTFCVPLVGGVLIGIAVSLMFLWNGRVTGVSGIVDGVLRRTAGDRAWRLSFVGGLIAGGILLKIAVPGGVANTVGRDLGTVVFGGLLVGFGTVMGSGCTSGHGICGISRFSPRSLIATMVFIGFGVVSATLFRMFFGSPS
jgi:uncharacterized membrane protein YedE/YeeE